MLNSIGLSVFSVSWLHNELNVAVVGHKVDLSYSYDHLGEDVSVLTELANGTHPFCQVIIHILYVTQRVEKEFCLICLFFSSGSLSCETSSCGCGQ